MFSNDFGRKLKFSAYISYKITHGFTFSLTIAIKHFHVLLFNSLFRVRPPVISNVNLR